MEQEFPLWDSYINKELYTTTAQNGRTIVIEKQL